MSLFQSGFAIGLCKSRGSVQSSGILAVNPPFRVLGLGRRVLGSGLRVLGSGFRV